MSYIILQHVDSLAMEVGRSISARRVISNLGLTVNEGLVAVGHLARAGFIGWDQVDSIELLDEGRDYLERGARRRRTVRLSNRA